MLYNLASRRVILVTQSSECLCKITYQYILYILFHAMTSIFVFSAMFISDSYDRD